MQMNSRIVRTVEAESGRKGRVSLLHIAILLIAGLVPLYVLFDWMLWGPPPPRDPRLSCIANLKQIKGAKEQWALEHQKLPTETPVEADLAGDSNDYYFRRMPVCPLRGAYTIGPVEEKATCSIPGHTY